MRVLVAYDGSTSADAAIDDLRRAGLPKDTEALAVCVAEGGLLDRGAEELAERAAARLRCHFPYWTVFHKRLHGAPAKAILEESERWHPELLVVGSHGRSPVARFLLGSVSLELIHKANCSVRIARARESAAGEPIRIVIGNDGSQQAAALIRSVAARPWPADTEVQIIAAAQTLGPVVTSLEASTYSQEEAYAVIREADERLRFRLGNIAAESANVLCRAGLTACSTVVEGDAREVILAAAETSKADVIFVGARGLGRMERLFLGSVSTYIVTHAHCTVEVIRTPHA